MAWAYPNIDPVALDLGVLAIRWYSLAYLAGILLGWQYMKAMIRFIKSPIPAEFVDDFIVWATFAIILGGRFGYVFFYNWHYYSHNLLEIFYVWQGGMSFHGGLLGMVVGVWWFCRAYKLPTLHFGDLVAAAAPIGLFFGRLANFINGELYGRVTTSSLGMVFPNGGALPRHPSQLYEATLEGIVLFVFLFFVARFGNIRQRRGVVFGFFLLLYGIFRILIEQFREPDQQLGYVMAGLTQGQMLSFPMLIAGFLLIVYSRRKSVIPRVPH